MPKKKRSKKPIRKSSSNNLRNFFHPKHRPAHGMLVGALLILLQGILGFFAIVGVIILLVSAVAYMLRLKKSAKNLSPKR